MALAKKLDQLGVFIREDFLPPSLCEYVCREIDAGAIGDGDVWSQGYGLNVREEVKRRKEVSYSADTKPELHRLLFEVSHELSERFQVELRQIQPLKFTRYDPGDFYKPHRDIVDDPDAPELIRSRKLAVTLFLNQQGDEPSEGDYCGGSLTFYGLVEDPAWVGIGIPLDSESGMMVAFRPDIVHEVTPITHGRRYAITTWFA
ncbi:MAG: 2OG-Fe(II) oxygenase [Pyrinomonadaceae bacterium]